MSVELFSIKFVAIYKENIDLVVHSLVSYSQLFSSHVRVLRLQSASWLGKCFMESCLAQD